MYVLSKKMTLISIEQITELNVSYCAILVNICSELSFKRLVLGNFFLKYPFLVKKIVPDIHLMDYEQQNYTIIKNQVRYCDSWDKVTLDAIRILVSKNLVEFKDNNSDFLISNNNTKKFYQKISKYPEFNETIERSKKMKKKLLRSDLNELMEVING
jgi:hypothetical protein